MLKLAVGMADAITMSQIEWTADEFIVQMIQNSLLNCTLHDSERASSEHAKPVQHQAKRSMFSPRVMLHEQMMVSISNQNLGGSCTLCMSTMLKFHDVCQN